MNIKRILLIILAVLIIAGSLGVMIRFSVPANKKPQNNKEEPIPDEELADVSEMYDFAEPREWENIGANYYSDNATVYLKSGDFIDNDGTLDFYVTKDQINAAYTANLDPYVVLGNIYELYDYSQIVYEVDVKMDEDYPFQIVIRPDYRQGPEEGSPQASTSSGIVCYSKGTFYVKDTTDVIHTIDENEFHFTYVVNSDNTCQVYINGELIYNTTRAYDETCRQINGLRLSAQYNKTDSFEGTAKVSFDNIQVKGYYPEDNTTIAVN